MMPADLTLTQAAAAIRGGRLSCLDYVDALIERNAAAGALNALIAHDPAQLRAAARRADEQRRAGATLGPLHGVPLVLKDNLDTVALPTTGGTPALRDNRPLRDAEVVRRLLAAGALVFGKANMHELALGVTSNNAAFGPVRNPYDPTRIAGGSSGGSAAAVAARLAPAAIGTDTGGSVRVPAALCGIVGLRPTTGRWPTAGIVPISHTRDTAGPMTRCVADAALLDAVVAGRHAPALPDSLRGVRIGVPRAGFYEDLDPDAAQVLDAALGRLADAGVILIERDLADVAALNEAAGFPISLFELVTDLSAYLRAHGARHDLASVVAAVASPDVRSILQPLLGPDAIAPALYQAALTRHRPALQQAYRSYFAQHAVCAVIFPTTPLPAAPLGADATCLLNGALVPTFTTFTRNTAPGSLAGIPGITLPAGRSAGGLPLGVALDAAAGDDERLLVIAALIEPLLPTLKPGDFRPEPWQAETVSPGAAQTPPQR